jgi:phospholipid-binding lipoprotein MlaA
MKNLSLDNQNVAKEGTSFPAKGFSQMLTRILTSFAALFFVASLSGCATPPTDPTERAEFDRVNDPLEPTNRVVFEFNNILDRFFMKPVAEAYRWVMPEFGQKVVSNILYNSGEPVRMANAALQGRFEDVNTIFERFFINTTMGIGGVADIATEAGVARKHADFGQTLHVWGAPEGPYLVLPLLGPSNPRDAIGFAGDSLASPYEYIIEDLDGVATRNHYIIASFGASIIDQRAESLDAMEALEKGSLDFYAQLRSVSRQYRHKQLGMSHEAFERGGYEEQAAPAAPAKVVKKRKKAAASAAPAQAPAAH